MADNNGLKNGYDLPKKLAIIYSDVKREYFPTEEQYITEKDSQKDAGLIAEQISKLGIDVCLVAGDSNLVDNLKSEKPEMILNLVDSVKGIEFLASTIPGVCELLEIPYTGSGMLASSLNYNKFLTNKLLEQNGVPVPNYQLFNSAKDLIYSNLRYPLILKLNEIHGGVEISNASIVENEKALRDRLAYLISTYKQSVLVEEFIVGREITAALLEGLNKKVYLAEIVFNTSDEYKYKSFDIQWRNLEQSEGAMEYRKYKDPLLNEYVKKAFSICDINDYARFDIRTDNSGRYYFIDVNTNPYLGPVETGSPVAKTLALYGVSFQEALKRLLINTVRDAKGTEKLPPTPGETDSTDESGN